jgi:hypothetical protein
MLITDIAFIKANLIMRKALDIITIVTGILMISILGGGFFTYKYVRSPQFEKMMMDKVTKKIEELLPKALDKGLPKVTGPSMPIIK